MGQCAAEGQPGIDAFVAPAFPEVRMGDTARAAIWDVDGTLVDTAELHYAAWVALAAEIGRPFTRADFAATFGRRNPEIIRALFEADASEGRVADIGERKEIMYR